MMPQKISRLRYRSTRNGFNAQTSVKDLLGYAVKYEILHPIKGFRMTKNARNNHD